MSQKQVLIYDGECRLCNNAVDFLKRNSELNGILVVSYQSVDGQKEVKDNSVEHPDKSLILIKEGETLRESDAVLELVTRLKWPLNLLYYGKWIPRVVRDRMYRWIASNRYKWFGKSDRR